MSNRLAIRASASILGAAVAALALWGCSPAAPPAPPAPPAPALPPAAAPAAPTPQRGGIMVYGQRSALVSLSPLKGDSPWWRAFIGSFEPLVRLEWRGVFDWQADQEIKPGLAESWEQPAPNAFVFHLRKNVKWHDGRPFTADDVVFTLEAWRDSAEAPRAYALGRNFTAVEKVDPYTVRLTVKDISPDFFPGMAVWSNLPYMLPAHRKDSLDKMPLIGTGPMKVKSVVLDGPTVLERNNDYWGPGQPYLDGGKVINRVEPSILQAAFAAREMDLMTVGDRTQFETLQKLVPQLQHHVFQAAGAKSFFFRQDRPPFNDPKVRQAFHLAIDRQALIKVLTQGDGAVNPPGGAGSKTGWGIAQDELSKLPGWRQPKDQDIAEAKRLLAEAGYAAGLKTELTRDPSASDAAIAEAVAPQLKAVGIDMGLGGGERAAFLRAKDDVSYEIYFDNAAGTTITDRLQGWFHTKGAWNKAGMGNPRLDQLIEQQDRTYDTAERKKLVYQAQKIITENMYAAPTIDFAAYAVWQPWLKDMAMSFSPQHHVPNWYDVWMDQATAPKRELGP